MDFTEIRPVFWAEFASLTTGDRWYVLEHTLMNLRFRKRGISDSSIEEIS